VTARIATCLADISAWMKEHHLQLNPAKTELLVFPANPAVEHNITVQLGPTTVSPSKTVRNLGVTIDEELISLTTFQRLQDHVDLHSTISGR